MTITSGVGTAALRVLFGLVVVGVSGGVGAPDVRAQGIDGRWIEVRSPHFIVVSNADEDDARQVAREFEVIRSVFQAALPESSDPRRRLTIIAAAGEEGLAKLMPQFWSQGDARPVGAFLRGSVEHHIVLRVDASQREGSRPVYHEYFHLLTSVNTGRLPPWLTEGFAEVYANTTVRGTTAEIGDARREHLALLSRNRLIPLDVLLAEDTNPHGGSIVDTALFYAQSWALTHYLLLGDDTGQGRRALDAYIERMHAGEDARAAFAATVGPLDDVSRALSRYVRRDGFFAMRIDTPPDVSERAEDEAERFPVRLLTSTEAVVLQARVLSHGGHRHLAKPLLDVAFDVKPDSPAVLEAIGLDAWYAGDDYDAGQAFIEANRLGSTSYISHYLGALLPRPASATEASRQRERSLRRAIELNERFAPAYAALARTLATQPEQGDEALALARTATELEPSDGTHWATLAVALLSADRPAEARDAAEHGFTVARTVEERVALRTVLENLEGAVAYYLRGNALRRIGQLEEAITAYRTAIRLAPDTIAHWNGLGIALREAGKTDDAIDAFLQVVTIEPSNAAAHHNLGNALHEQRKLDAAVNAYRTAIALDPEGEGTHRLLGDALRALGDRDGAIAAYRQAMALDPSDTAARQRLATLVMESER